MELVQLVYHSTPASSLSGGARLAAFRAIHSAAVARNVENGIGGFLMLTRTHFVQILEGERNAVMATYERIRRDPRHMDCTLLDILTCRTRSFEAWAMGTIHDELRVREALLGAGIGADRDIIELSAKQIAGILIGLAEQSKSMAA